MKYYYLLLIYVLLSLVYLPTSSLAVSFNQDSVEENDAEEELSSGNVNFSNNSLILGEIVPAQGTLVGLRFPNVTIPSNATITSAFLELTSAADNQSGKFTWTIEGEKIGDSFEFKAENKNIFGRTPTIAGTTWSMLDDWNLNQEYKTPNIKDVVKEIIKLYGWSSGNAMSFFISGTGTRQIHSVSSTLQIEYTSPGILQFEQSNYSVNENETSIEITVTRTKGSKGIVSVTYQDNGGTATVDEDYLTITPSTLEWVDGETTPKAFIVTIVNDLLVESNENIELELNTPTGNAILGVDTVTTLTIVEDDQCSKKFVVTNTNNGGPGSLREAINTDCNDEIDIDFDPSLANQTIFLEKELTIDKKRAIKNSQAKLLKISGNNKTRIFKVESTGKLYLKNITIVDGFTSQESGAGIYITLPNSLPNVEIINSTFLNNKSTCCDGGAIYNEGKLTITNSTFVDNQAGGEGGALYSNGVGVDITNSTFSGNKGNQYGGIVVDGGQFLLKNTIIVNSKGEDCQSSVLIEKNINNFIGKSNSCAPINTSDPKLGPLQNNGGFTKTLALLPNSPAINAGANEINNQPVCPTHDQRNMPRADPECDVGAFEVVPICEVQTEMNYSECQALLNFYDQTNGPNWKDDLDNDWKKTLTPCSWAGITCEDEHVTGISREGQNLSGNLPNLSNFPVLKHLHLSNNQLSDTIPDLSSLIELEQVDLGANRFSGTVPDLSMLTNLTRLSLDNNQLGGEIPASLNDLNNLSTLELDYNKLTANLSSKAPNWLETQTILPFEIAAQPLSATQIQLTWTPIPYTDHGGYYQAKCGTTLGGPNYPIQVKTQDKAATGVTIGNLTANTTYYCVVNTYTPAHGEQQNDLTSLVSKEVVVTTLPSQTPSPNPPSGKPTLDVGSSVVNKSIQTEFDILNNLTMEIAAFEISGDDQDNFKIISPTLLPVNLDNGSQNLNLIVQCTPSHVGLHTAVLKLVPTNSQLTPPSYLLTCTGKQPAKYISSPAPNSTLVIGNSLVNKPVSKTFRIKEGGEEDLQVDFIGITGTHASNFKVTKPTFPFTLLDDGAEQTVTVTCTPSKVGYHTAILQLRSNDTTQPTPTYHLKCKGVPPGTVNYVSTPLPKQPIDFGDSLVNTPITVELTIANKGNLDLVVDLIEVTGEHVDSFDVLESPFPVTLTQNQAEQIVTLQCLPSHVGLHTATLHLRSNDPDYPTLTYPLTCNGLAQSASYTSTPPPNSKLDFGSSPLGKTVTFDLTIAENGNSALEVSEINIIGSQANHFQLLNLNLPITIVDGAPAKKLTIQCTPTTVGLHTAQLTVRTNDPVMSSPTYTLHCYGITEMPGYDSTPAPEQPLDIGSREIGLPVNAPLVIWAKNNTMLKVLSNQIQGNDATHFQIIHGRAPFALRDSNSTHTLLIQCLPQRLGPHAAQLILTTNDPERATVHYDLTCTGLPSVNQPPQEVTLSNNSVSEDSPGGTLIGKLITRDPDDQTHHYTLLNNAGGLFMLQNDELKLSQSAHLDFETIARYSIKVRSTDPQGLFIDETLTIQVNDIHEAQFIGKIVTETGTVGKKVGIDASEQITVIGYIKPSHNHIGKQADIIMTYHWFPAGGEPSLTVPVTIAKQIRLQPDMEMTLFTGKLIGLAGLFEVNLGYQLPNGQYPAAQIITLEVRPNRSPDQIQLSNRIIVENAPPDTVVGRFTTSDPDKQERFYYGLVNNPDNYFKVVENQLQVNFRLDHELSTEYPIRVRSVDSSGAYIEEQFVIQVTDQEGDILDFYLTQEVIAEDTPSGGILGRFWVIDYEPGTYTYELVEPDSPFIIKGDTLLLAEDAQLDFETQPVYSVIVLIQKHETGQSIEKTFLINLLNNVDVTVLGEIYDQITGQLLEPNRQIYTHDDLVIKVHLYPDQTHQGQQAELLSIAFWQPPLGPSMIYMLAGNTWTEWNLDLATLDMVQSLTLQEHHEMTLWSGKLTQFGGGQFKVLTGYRLVSGEVIYSPKPFDIQVKP